MVSNLIATGQYNYNNALNRWQDKVTGQIVSFAAAESEMRKHQEATYSALNGLTEQLYSGGITLEQWQIGVAAELKDAHLAQSMYAAGGKFNMTSVEYGRVGGTLADEYKYLADFADDIAAGKVSQAQALARVRQYGNSTQQSYWREFAQAAPDVEIWWELNPAEHCPDCIALAAGSPYKPNELTTYPGAGATRCRGNCKCNLRRK